MKPDQNPREPLPMKSKVQLRNISPLTTNCIIKSAKKIKDAFPNLSEGFYDLLWEMMKKQKLSDERLERAVEGVVLHCTYPSPTIAEFFKWDRDHPWRIMETGKWFYLDKTGAYVSRDGDVYMA